MTIRAVSWVRTVTFVALMLVMVFIGVSSGWTPSVFLFIATATAWFSVTICTAVIAPLTGRAKVLRRVMFAMIDAYLIVACISNVTGKVPVAGGALGLYCFFSTSIGGPLAGIAGAVAGCLAWIQSDVLPFGFIARNGMMIASAAAGGVVCGLSWRVALPVLWHAIVDTAGGVSADEALAQDGSGGDTANAEPTKVEEMQKQLEKMSYERDHAMERIEEMELKLDALKEGSKKKQAELKAKVAELENKIQEFEGASPQEENPEQEPAAVDA